MSNRVKVLALGLICFATGATEFIIVGLLDVIAESVGVSVGSAGLLVTAYAVAAGIGTPLAMMGLASRSRRTIMTIALALVAAGCVLMAMPSGFASLLVARAMMAVGAGVFNVCCFSAAAAMAAPGREGAAVATITTSFSAAMVLGLPLGRALTSFMDWTQVFWISAAIALASILIVRRVVADGRESAPLPLRSQLALLKNPVYLATFSISLFWLVGYSLLYSYISPVIQAIVPLSAGALSVALLVFGVLTLVGNSAGGALADRMGRMRTIAISLGVQAVALLVLAVSGGNAAASIVALAAWTVVCWGPAAVQQLNVIALSPEASGVTLSLHNTVIQVAYAAGSAIGGAAVNAAGLGTLPPLSAVFAILGIAAVAVAVRLGRKDGGSERIAGKALDAAAE